MTTYDYLIPCLAAIAILLAFVKPGGKSKTSSNAAIPPGPNPIPFFGNMFQIPNIKPYLYFTKLNREYGPIVRLTVAGQEMLVLGDHRDAEELLGRRSQNYSSRRPFVFAGKHLSHNKRLVLLPYGSMLKRQRQAFHQMLQPRVVGAYESMQTEECIKLLYDMSTNPDGALINVRRFAASMLSMLAYGQHLTDGDKDGDLKQLMSITSEFLDDFEPGRHLVDEFPWMDNWLVPDWIARWRGEAKKRHDSEISFYTRLIRDVKKKLDKGIMVESFATQLWGQQKKLDMDEECMAYVAGSAFEAGTGNVAGTIQFFLLASVLHPEKLKKMQEEIDSVLGTKVDEPPTFEHIDKLPYCVAYTKEVLRWIPAAPISFPHCSVKDDEYKGYTIPAGTVVVPNVWAMHRDDKLFPEAAKFIPERWLKEKANAGHDSLIDGHWAFGWGRRVCPGQHMAAKSVWIAMAQLAWAFNIGRAFDEEGNPYPVSEENVVPSLTLEPLPFKMSITPRTEKHRELIQKMWEESKARAS